MNTRTITSSLTSVQKKNAEATVRANEAALKQAKIQKQTIKKDLKRKAQGEVDVEKAKKQRSIDARETLIELREGEREAKKNIEKAKKTIRKTPYSFANLRSAMAGVKIMADDFIDKSQKPLSHVRVFKAKSFKIGDETVGLFPEVVLSYRPQNSTYHDPEEEGNAVTYTVEQLVNKDVYYSWLRAKNIGICRIKADKDDVKVLSVKDCVKGGKKRKSKSKKRRSSSSKKSLRIISGPKKGRCRYGKRKGSGKCRSKATLRITSGSKKGKCRFGKRKGSKKCRKRSKRKSRK